ncbi:hypothetical protein [Nonomuraea sp. SYSU D8015]|uniref:hypothetical protein n=1 Tax=Nonomuraea sp. SYSU D8015 TaxID=2593644 RepID=UPI0016617825|nr:hypothetical protein [Nonomuraea sp. SYSU D8015]
MAAVVHDLTLAAALTLGVLGAGGLFDVAPVRWQVGTPGHLFPDGGELLLQDGVGGASLVGAQGGVGDVTTSSGALDGVEVALQSAWRRRTRGQATCGGACSAAWRASCPSSLPCSRTSSRRSWWRA